MYKFITIEGPDGAGKTTQLKKLSDWFENNNHKFILTREPGGTNIGEIIRALVLKERIDPLTDLLLFIASRNEHIKRVIEPAYKRGDFILCDRYMDSSIVYQGIIGTIGVNKVMELNKVVVGKFIPDLTLVIDVDIENSKKRMDSRNEDWTKYDQMNIKDMEKVREGFLKLKDLFPERIFVIDGSKDSEEVFDSIIKIITKKYELN